MSRFLFPTSIRLASHGCLSGNSSIHRTAVCGPACAVVWEGRRGDSPPYPDFPPLSLRHDLLKQLQQAPLISPRHFDSVQKTPEPLQNEPRCSLCAVYITDTLL